MLEAALGALSVQTSGPPPASSASSSPESGIDTGSPESRDGQEQPSPLAVSKPIPATNFRHRSHSEANFAASNSPVKSILKRRCSTSGLIRTISEGDCNPFSSGLESPFPSLASSIDESSCLDESGGSRKKSVRFAERVTRHCFKSTSSILAILGEGKNRSKKNQKRKAARLRRNSQGESSEPSEAESTEDSVARLLATSDEDKAVQFPIDPIPEEEATAPKLTKKRASARVVSVSDDDEETEAMSPSLLIPVAYPGPEFHLHDADEDSELEETPPSAPPSLPAPPSPELSQEKKKRKKKKKNSRKAKPPSPPPADERKESQDSGIGLDETPLIPAI